MQQLSIVGIFNGMVRLAEMDQTGMLPIAVFLVGAIGFAYLLRQGSVDAR